MSFELDPTFAADPAKHFDTLQVHAGLTPDPTTGSAALPIYATAAWQFDDAEDAAAKFALARPGNVYSRLTNTTTDCIAARVAAIEGAASAVAVASGHAAEILAFTNIAKAGDEIVASDSLYGGTWNILLHTLDDLGIKTTFVPNNDIDAFVAASNERTKFWYVETIGNPLVDVADVPALVDAAASLNLPVIVDNTFATRVLAQRLRDIGPTLSPYAAQLIGLGIETLSLRVQRHSDNALAVAKFLKDHPKVSWVRYSGLEDDPSHEVASRLFKHGFGGALVFGVKGGREAGLGVINNVKLHTLLANVGDAKSLIIHPASTTHSQLTAEQLEAAHLSEDLIRLSVGIENVDDIIADLDQALAAV